MKKKQAVVVTTEHRGVFFGYVADDKKLPSQITLTDARICVYWSAQTHGVLGLAASGPNSECRISPSVPKFTAYKVTSVTDCSEEATKNWELGLWK